METKKMRKKIDITLLMLVTLVLLALAACFWKGGYQLVVSGFERAGQLRNTIWLRLLLGFTLGGLVQVLMPRALIAKWLGPDSGLKGIFVASYTGTIMTGGPYIRLPIVSSILRAGAGVGPIIALLTGAALLGIQGLIVWEIPFLGVGIPLARYIVCLFIPPLVGLAGGALFRVVSRSPQAATESDYSVSEVGQRQDGTGETHVTSDKEGEA
jgi:uncharacterized membrane protein YraQ (UPF0718 family)